MHELFLKNSNSNFRSEKYDENIVILTGLSNEKKHSSLYTLSWGPGIREDPAKPSKADIISILF